MTLLHDATNDCTPGTHVLAIGVGSYPYLLGGNNRLANKPLGLKQLLSPPVSLKRFLDWCFVPVVPSSPGLMNARIPLATVEALASTPQPFVANTPSGESAVDAATRQNIQGAFEGWLERLRSHPDNIGVFYFCGHGIMVAEHYLLAEDFGCSNAQPWQHAFDITNTIRAVEREVSSSTFYFIDACREISREVAMTLAANPSALWVADLSKTVVGKSATQIYATGEGELAFAPLGGQVSRFTAALIYALSGHCGTKVAGSTTWDVTGENIAAAIVRIMEFEGRHTGGKQVEKQVGTQTLSGCQVPLLTLTVAPMVKVVLDLTPAERRSLYEIYLLSVNGKRIAQEMLDQAFQLELPRGFYDVGARDLTGSLPAVLHEDEELVPPLYTYTLESRP
jgi:Caspase domain